MAVLAGRNRALQTFLVVAAAATTLQFAPQAAVRSLSLDGISVVAAAAAIVGVRRYRPAPAGIWYLFALAAVLSAVGLVPAQFPALGGVALTAASNACFIGAYTLMISAALWAGLGGHRARERTAFLDLAILFTAMSTTLWLLIYRPLILASHLAAEQRILTALYPVADAILVVVAANILISTGGRRGAMWALVVALLGELASDLYQGVASSQPAGPAAPRWLDAGWFVTAVAFGLAALLPSMADITSRASQRPGSLGNARLVALGMALVAPPAAAAIASGWIGQPFDAIDVLIPWLVLTILILIRIRWLFLDKEWTEAVVAARERRYRSLLEHQSDHVLVVGGDGRILYQSPSVYRHLGYTPGGLVGEPIEQLIDSQDHAVLEALLTRCRGREDNVVRGTLLGLDRSGAIRRFEATLTNLEHDEAVGGVVVALHDSTERAEFEGQLRYQALHDPLTGLPNRTLVAERATQWIAAAAAGDARRQVSALFVDLDNFKEVNDSLGHNVGDDLLVSVAQRLKGAVGATDLVGRVGGDEFVVLVDPNGPGSGPRAVSERILHDLREPFDVAGRPYTVTASVGLASGVWPSADALLRDADVAMYQAKAAGKNACVEFEPSMRNAAHERWELASALQAAVAAGSLSVVYQPIINLHDGRLSGAEALVRWHHPGRGWVPPEVFIPVAERHGLVGEIGRFVLREACRAAMSWPVADHPLTVAVNISYRQLESDGLADDIFGAVGASGLAIERLVLELTEATVAQEPDLAAERIAMVKRTGVRVAIDDFGTGYSSLASLERLPVDVLKIDRSFVAAVHPERGDAVVAAVARLGRALDLRVVAEGVETAGQLDRVRRAGCDAVQGNLFSTPLEPEAFVAYARDTVARPVISAES